MATNISNLSVAVTVDAAKAETGLMKLGGAVDRFAESVTQAGSMVKDFLGGAAFTAGIGVAIKKFADFNQTINQTTLSLSGVFGSMANGTKAAQGLLSVSSKTGIAYEQLAEGIERLGQSGLGVGGSLSLLEKAGRLDPLFGGQGKGVDAFVTAITNANKQMVATSESFDMLRERGVDAYGALARVLGVTSDKAKELVKTGRVSGFQAAQAIQGAASDPEAQRSAANNMTLISFGTKLANDLRNGVQQFDQSMVQAYGNLGSPEDTSGYMTEADKADLALAEQKASIKKQFQMYLDEVGKPFQNGSDFDRLMSNLAVMQENLKTAGELGIDPDRMKAISEQMAGQIEKFAAVPMNAFESLGKQASDLRDQIGQARNGGQGDLASALEARLATLAQKTNKNLGPLEAVFEGIDQINQQAAKAVEKFPGPELNAKLANDRSALLDSLKTGPDSPVGGLIAGLEDIRKAGEKLAKVDLSADQFAQARDRLAIRENKLLEDFEASVLTPYESFTKKAGDLTKQLEEAAKVADPAQAKRLADVLNKQQAANQAQFIEPVLTDFERFNNRWGSIQANLDQATAAGDQIGITRFTRELGALFNNTANTLPKISDSFFADSAQIGSVESYRAEMRAQFGDSTMSAQERIAAAQERMERQGEQQLAELKNAVTAIRNQRPMPGKLQIAAN